MIFLKVHYDRQSATLQSKEKVTQTFGNLLHELETNQQNLLGYQESRPRFAELAPFLDFHLNNAGDPFVPGNYMIQTKKVEKSVLEHYARLWDAAPNSWWGYVLTMGSTEGIIFGLLSARDYLKGQRLVSEPKEIGLVNKVAHEPKALKPIAFFSKDTHYSVGKACAMLKIKTFGEAGEKWYPGQCPTGSEWPTRVPSNADGSIHVPSLLLFVEFFASRGHPIIVVLNLGSTFKGCHDEMNSCTKGVVSICEKYGLAKRTLSFENGVSERRGYWVHIDGALGAGYFPYLKMTSEYNQQVPNFTFANNAVCSISVSGHKWIGTPWPTGVYMCRKNMQVAPAGYTPEYVGSPDTTLAGSRNGMSPLILAYHIEHTTQQTEIQRVLATFHLIEWFMDQLKQLERQLGMDLWIERSHLSLAVRFRKLCPELITKYSIASEKEMGWNLNTGASALIDVSHIYIMRNTNKETLEKFLEDCVHKGTAAFLEQPGLSLQLHK
jgi:histidine decarboxylase